MSKKDRLIKEAFHEIKKNPPSTLKKGVSVDKRRKQEIAIALSKARSRGANIPKKGK